jgi:nucleoside-diphosphate-sugar epimerase
MTTLVTGAAGFLGGHVAELLLAEGEPTAVLLRPGEDLGPLTGTPAEPRWSDIADGAAMAAALDGVKVVINCAARTGPWGPVAEYAHSNVAGLRTLVSAAMAAGVRRVVHVSSITVHGNDVHGRADEDSPMRGAPNPYSRSKVAGERALDRMIREQGAPVTIVRPGWIYGPRSTHSFARFAHAIEGQRMIMIGAGDNRIPLVYVTDVARGVLAAASTDRAEGRTYLLVSDEPVTQRDYLYAIADQLGAPRPRRRIPYRVALALGWAGEMTGHAARMKQPPPLTRYGVQLIGGENRFDISRARAELGFAPQVAMRDGVRMAAAWYRSDHTSPAAVGARA